MPQCRKMRIFESSRYLQVEQLLQQILLQELIKQLDIENGAKPFPPF